LPQHGRIVIFNVVNQVEGWLSIAENFARARVPRGAAVPAGSRVADALQPLARDASPRSEWLLRCGLCIRSLGADHWLRIPGLEPVLSARMFTIHHRFPSLAGHSLRCFGIRSSESEFSGLFLLVAEFGSDAAFLAIRWSNRSDGAALPRLPHGA